MAHENLLKGLISRFWVKVECFLTCRRAQKVISNPKKKDRRKQTAKLEKQKRRKATARHCRRP